jgi:hypothetical protein
MMIDVEFQYETISNEHRSGGQKIPRLSWSKKLDYRAYNSPPVVPVLNPMNVDHTLTSYFFNIHLILPSHLRLGLPSVLFWFSD